MEKLFGKVSRMNEGWKLVKRRLEDILGTYISRRENARSRGYSGVLYSYTPGIKSLRVYLEKANADDLGNNLLPWMTGLQIIQTIYEYPSTPVEIKRWIDKVAEKEDIRVGKRIVVHRGKEEIRKERRKERAKKLKPGMLVSDGSVYGIVTGVDNSYIYADSVMSAYHLHHYISRMKIPSTEVRIPTESSLKRFFRRWKEYIEKEAEFENKWNLTTRHSIRDKDEMEKAIQIVRKLGYRI